MTHEATSPMTVQADFAAVIAEEVQLDKNAVAAVIGLLDEGCTVPFIARYRKEVTGGAEDSAISQTMERLQFHREFYDRKCVILDSIHKQGKLTPELQSAIESAKTRSELEDLYLPYRPKRRTRAIIAKEKGLEPLAERMWNQEDISGTPEEFAEPFVNAELGVGNSADALQGACDIIAERVVETADWRAEIRELTWTKGLMHAKAARGKSETNSKFTDYYDFSEAVSQIPSHRILAILRGEKEGYISQHILPDPELAKSILCDRILRKEGSIWSGLIRQAAEDAYDRLLSQQIATEVRAELKLQADYEAIEVFAANLKDLLMAPPFGARSMLAIDPGYRTGCKVVILDETGRLLEHGVVYPTVPKKDIKGTEAALDRWFEKYPDLAAVVVGNGTGGRETFAIVSQYVKSRGHRAGVILVNESGASVYSASDVAREELPDHDVTVRGAVSIGRRLQDPLAELVKIDPKSIGVGQYQHDVDQKLLKQKLDDVVVTCVNRVGVDVNMASASLLRYVSGLGAKLARALVAHRDDNGPFKSREEMKKVPGMGEKTFEQAAGFLRVTGNNPLDNSAVHPERYDLVERIAADLQREVADLIGDDKAVHSIDLENYIDNLVGMYTLQDIMEELVKPGRDPRDDFAAVEFREDVQEIEDLTEGMLLNGVVTNVTKFGAFVDVGVHQDGLVHVSQIADRFVSDPAEELHVGQTVKVRVLSVDLERRRISLSIKEA
ncbi:MAG: Tex family protein [Candidatus Latescibacterota bacterium]